MRQPWIMWVGLIIIFYVAMDMIYDGTHEVTCKAYQAGCEVSFWEWTRASIFKW